MESFEQRKADVEAYLDFLRTIEEIMSKKYSITNRNDNIHLVTGAQYKILIANAYILLYNLIESTMSQCFKKVADSICNIKKEEIRKLIPSVKNEWLKHIAETINKKDKAFDLALDLIENLNKNNDLPEFKFVRINSNWDDCVIEKKGKCYSINLCFSGELNELIKKHRRDDLGAIKIVKDRRNKLAHGEIAFTEIAKDETYSEIYDIATIVFKYLDEIIQRFDEYIKEKNYFIKK